MSAIASCSNFTHCVVHGGDKVGETQPECSEIDA